MKTFEWPDGKRCAVSITFDDARDSQLDIGVPILDAFGVKATFYCPPSGIERRPDDWRRALSSGHEIGNHSTTHPCSGNFWFSRDVALEDYTYDQMRADIVSANDRIEALIGKRPTTFAYPCGQTFVGRGVETRSYIPIVAELFDAGRGFRNEYFNDPRYVDLAQAGGTEFDGMSVADLDTALDSARNAGGWLYLAGHDVGAPGRQVVDSAVLEHLCRCATTPGADMWCATAADVAAYMKAVLSQQ